MAQPTHIFNTLSDALDITYRTADLQTIASIICATVPTRKAERIEAIVTTLFKDPETIFNQLHPVGQSAVAETIHNWGGHYEGRMFINKYSSSPFALPEGSDKRTERLIDLFLVQRQVPRDLMEKLRAFVTKPTEDEIHYVDDDTVLGDHYTVRETSRPALENLATLLHFTADKKMRVSAKTGQATTATSKKIDDLLYEGDWYDEEDEVFPMQSFAWPLLLQGGGLAKADGSFLKLTPAGRKTLKNDLPNGIKTIWKKWEKSKIIDEFSRVTAIKGQKSHRGRTMTSLAKRRPMINMLLEDLEPGKWVSVDELLRVIQATSLYSFEMVNYDWKLYIVDQHYGHLDYHDTWQFLQFRYLLVVLFEYYATLGIVDVTYQSPYEARTDYLECWGSDELDFLSHCDGLQYIRVNDLGAFALGHTDEFVIQNYSDNLYTFEETEILFTGSDTVPPGQVLYLEKIAERKEIDRWHLSATSLLGAINAGESLAAIKETLGTLSSTQFSKEIDLLFQEVEQRSTAFVDMGKATLIKCNREFRKQILTHKKLSNLCLPAGEMHLVILPGKEKAFAGLLESLGFVIGR